MLGVAMKRTDSSDRAGLWRQRLLTVLATGLIALIAAVIWLNTEVPATEHFFSLDATTGLTWAWRAAGAALLLSLFAIAWIGTQRRQGQQRLLARGIALGIAAVLAGLTVGVLGVDRHGGATPAGVDLTATVLMGAGALLAAGATVPILAAEGRSPERRRRDRER